MNADENFPSENYRKCVVRADGLYGVEMLSVVLIPLDTYTYENFILISVCMHSVDEDKIYCPASWNISTQIILRELF